MARRPVELEKNAGGGLAIWQQPAGDRVYVIGADAAGGGPDGDFAAACVIEAESCALVARYHGHIDPHHFGPLCARLGWYFNEAMLAFETQPSAHGYSAATEAKNMGYSRLYRKHRDDTGYRQPSDTLGWHTNSTTKPQMIDRVKKALDDRVDIPDELLVTQLGKQRWNENDEMITLAKKDHDDIVIAFAVALKVRDNCWTRGLLRPPTKQLVTWEDRYWHHRRQKMLAPRRGERRRAWGGV